jgi:hypothetical protein
VNSSKDFDPDLTEKGIETVRRVNKERRGGKVIFICRHGKTEDVKIEHSIKEK